MPLLEKTQSPDTNAQNEHRAIHAFFKTLAKENPYAILLGGSLTPTNLNQKIIIGVEPKQLISVEHHQLSHWHYPETPIEKTLLETKAVTEPDELFNTLRQHTWTENAFLFAGYESYQYCETSLFELKQKPEFSLKDYDLETTSLPDFLLIDFEAVGVYDCAEGRWHWQNSSADKIANLEKQWEQALSKTSEPLSTYAGIDSEQLESYTNTFAASLSKTEFEAATDKILDHIRAGDLYQANLSLALSKIVEVKCPFTFYEHLCQNSPAPFSAFLKTPETYLISNSPERLLSADSLSTGNKHIQLQTRPIAGTRGRGKTEAEDQQLKNDLLNNQKERAEHLMLVDLLRNDLGRVCKPGSVSVNELFAVEQYSHVTHLVSNVVGTLDQAKHDFWDVLKAIFPGGTITGCPKIRCIEILNELEPYQRGFYTGSLGYLNLSGRNDNLPASDWNILIRTLQLTPLKTPLAYNADSISFIARLQVGAGIVADSVPSHEYRECHRKAQALLGALYVAEQPTNPARH